MSIGVKIDVVGLPETLGRLNALGRIEFHELLDGLARKGQQQTQRRIETEKTSPDGAAWPLTRDGRAALFVTGAHLYLSIDHAAGATEARWGTGWIGAKVHQFGATIVPKDARALHFMFGGEDVFAKKVTIPARPYLGVSAQNARDLEAAAAKFIERYVQ
ncbi:MAG: phage virion morphogenesis protein [Roseiarcus sp.]